jgi:hypothetical protein
VNDLLPQYADIRVKWQRTRIQIKDTFGSTSRAAKRPVYCVVAFGWGIDGEAMREVCESLKDLGEWYVEYVPREMSAGWIYVGAYGYGGEAVARLTEDLLAAMAEPGFSALELRQWVEDNSVTLDADYVKDEPPPPVVR